MLKIITLLLMFSINTYAQNFSLKEKSKLSDEYTLISNSHFNLALKSPLILHNSLKNETHFVLIFKKDQKNLDHPNLSVFKKDNHYQYVLYSFNASSDSIHKLTERLKDEKKTVFNFSATMLPKAHAAETCAINYDLGPSTNVDNVAAHTSSASLTDSVLDCMSGLLQGVWDATGGLVIDAAGFVWDIITSPIETAKKTYAQFQSMLSMIKNLDQTLADFGAFFSSLPTEAKTQMICSFLGSLGTDVLITVLTLGAGSGKLLLSFSNYLKKLSKLTKTMKLAKLTRFDHFFPKEFLTKLAQGRITDKILDRIELFSKHNMPELSRQAVRCAL
jgi:hypothetical protein